jgi:FMN phosphatase YigB (HAD superfamily)
MTTCNYVCFDIGNVLFHINFDPLLKRLSDLYGITKEEGNAFLNGNQKHCDLGLIMVRDEFVEQFHEKDGKVLDELFKLWKESIVVSYSSMLLLDRLREKGYKIALMSNIGHEHKVRVDNDAVFSDCVKFLSCDVGARKPTLLYYKTFIEMYPQFKYAPYIDDIQENLDMGKRFGLKPIRFALDECNGKWLEATEELEKKIDEA